MNLWMISFKQYLIFLYFVIFLLCICTVYVDFPCLYGFHVFICLQTYIEYMYILYMSVCRQILYIHSTKKEPFYYFNSINLLWKSRHLWQIWRIELRWVNLWVCLKSLYVNMFHKESYFFPMAATCSMCHTGNCSQQDCYFWSCSWQLCRLGFLAIESIQLCSLIRPKWPDMDVIGCCVVHTETAQKRPKLNLLNKLTPIASQQLHLWGFVEVVHRAIN